MSKILFCRLVFLAIPLLVNVNTTQAQPDHFAYAVTGINKGGSEWIAVRKLDTRTGEYSSVLLNLRDREKDFFDFSVYKEYAAKDASKPVTNATPNVSAQPVLSSSVAAIAYDRKSNRLYYSPMSVDQLRYINLSTMETFAVSDQFFSRTGKYDFKTAGPINRLVIAPDDYGYTITNDGNHLIRFTTNASPVLTDLGELVDDPHNKEMSIHNPCANSGGDLIADDAGFLYLITGSNRVYKVDISSRVTTYISTVSGLPEKFATSGLAVSENGAQILASSSLYSDAYFVIDPETWIATPSHARATSEIFGSADLANSNVLLTKNTATTNMFFNKDFRYTNKVRVFPNPVMDDIVSIQFKDLPPGNYTIQLADVFGSKVLDKKAVIVGSSQTETLHIPSFTAQGFYYIRILDAKDNVVETQKLVVERW